MFIETSVLLLLPICHRDGTVHIESTQLSFGRVLKVIQRTAGRSTFKPEPALRGGVNSLGLYAAQPALRAVTIAVVLANVSNILTLQTLDSTALSPFCGDLQAARAPTAQRQLRHSAMYLMCHDVLDSRCKWDEPSRCGFVLGRSCRDIQEPPRREFQLMSSLL